LIELGGEREQVFSLEAFPERVSRVQNLVPYDQLRGTPLVLLRGFPPRGSGGKRRVGRAAQGVYEVDDYGALDRGEAAVPD